ncbi:Phage integrase family [Micromonospora rhizosphaerae]|uniref:Phage integrase family n=1 Tax=Micromonospora rhizosphaerae TaxID=568872 RepID=A0A1C6RUW3_9ACTN|nr:hypothetical protein [Micromonospora rhizosphaerae]SCL20800.1 Phage integrase family [Micromonospora rhizosphaerae]
MRDAVHDDADLSWAVTAAQRVHHPRDPAHQRPTVHHAPRERASTLVRAARGSFSARAGRQGKGDRVARPPGGTTGTTLLYEQGVPIEKIQDILGHSFPNITKVIYVEVTRQSQRPSVDKLGFLFDV